MRAHRMPTCPAGRRAGFTLAEVLVTILIVGFGLLQAFQLTSRPKVTAAHTRNMKLARELGLLTLGQIEAGLFWEDIDSGRTGTYEDYPNFFYELALGDETFIEVDPGEGAFDNWSYREELRRDSEDYDEDEEDMAQPYEEVRVRVTFPVLREGDPNELILERWVPWTQVYGEDEDAEDGGEEEAAEDDG